MVQNVIYFGKSILRRMCILLFLDENLYQLVELIDSVVQISMFPHFVCLFYWLLRSGYWTTLTKIVDLSILCISFCFCVLKSIIRCINVENGYVLMISLSIYHYEMILFIPGNKKMTLFIPYLSLLRSSLFDINTNTPAFFWLC